MTSKQPIPMLTVVKQEPDDGSESIDIQPGQRIRISSNAERITCDICNISVFADELSEHTQSRSHQKKIAASADSIDDRDLFINKQIYAYRKIMESKSRIAGCEYIIYDSDEDITKCTLCTKIIRDVDNSIVEHVLSLKHVHTYFQKHFPEMFRSIQRKAKTKAEINTMISKYCDDMIKKYGKKEPLTYKKGFFNSLDPMQQQAVERSILERKREYEDQKKNRLPGEEANQISNVQLDEDSQGSTRMRNRSGSQQNRRNRRAALREKYDRRQRSTSHSRDRGRNRRSQSSDKGTERPRVSPHEYNLKARNGTPLFDDVKSSIDENIHLFQRVKTPEPLEEEQQRQIDKLDDLPTDIKIYEVLCEARAVPLPDDVNSFIQPFIDQMNFPILGIQYMTEYIDARQKFEPGYLCTICEVRLNPRQAVRHAMAEEHAMKYLEKEHPKKAAALQISTLSLEVRDTMKQRYMNEINQIENRRRITHRLVIDRPNRYIFRHHRLLLPEERDVIYVNDPLPPTPPLPTPGFKPASMREVKNDSDTAIWDPPKGQRNENSTLKPFAGSEGQSVSPVSEDELPEYEQSGPSSVKRQSSGRMKDLKEHDDRSKATKRRRSDRSRSLERRRRHRRRQSTSSSGSGSYRSSSRRPLKPQTLIAVDRFDAEIEYIRSKIPPDNVVNEEKNYYSQKQKTLSFYRFVAAAAQLPTDPTPLYVSLRAPTRSQLPYGDYNPMLMRRLQDKFNFSMNQIRALQSLLVKWHVPFYQKLKPIDLKPLEYDVETTVLAELFDHVLKPVTMLRNMETKVYHHLRREETLSQISEVEASIAPSSKNGRDSPRLSEDVRYKRHRAKRSRRRSRSSSDERRRRRRDAHERERKNTDRRRESKQQRDDSYKRSSEKDADRAMMPNNDDLRPLRRGGDGVKLTMKVKPREQTSSLKRSRIELKPANEQENMTLQVIDQVLAACHSNCDNDVLKMVVSFDDARLVLFRLATQRPTEMAQLANLCKMPQLKAPESMLQQLRSMLEQFLDENTAQLPGGNEQHNIANVPQSSMQTVTSLAQDDVTDQLRRQILVSKRNETSSYSVPLNSFTPNPPPSYNMQEQRSNFPSEMQNTHDIAARLATMATLAAIQQSGADIHGQSYGFQRRG